MERELGKHSHLISDEKVKSYVEKKQQEKQKKMQKGKVAMLESDDESMSE